MRLRSQQQTKLLNDAVISTTSFSSSIKLGSTEMPCSIQIIWGSGIAVNMELSLQYSNDNQNWVDVSGTEQAITDASGNHMWDIETGAEFVRVKITVTGGSATFNGKFNGKVRE